jgi:hypothetical protein
VPSGGALGPVQLHDSFVVGVEESGQPSAVAAGAFNRPDAFARLLLGQCQQLAGATGISWAVAEHARPSTHLSD